VRFYSIPALELPDWLARGWRVRYTWRTDRLGNGALVEGAAGCEVPPPGCPTICPK